MNHAISILGGGPLRQFSDDNFPTVRDVLRYYMQFWKLKGSESKREKIVARDLMAFYQHRNISIMSEPGIKYKVKRLTEQLNSIIKSRTRPKTVSRAHFETEFMNRLNTCFQIAVAEPTNVASDVIMSSNQPGTFMGSENSSMDCVISSNSDVDMHESNRSSSDEQYYDLGDGDPYYYFRLSGEPMDPDSSDDEDYTEHEMRSIPDESLWKMFGTGVPFRTLSIILNEAFEISGNGNQFYTSQTHLFNKYKQMHAQKELEYKESISANHLLGSICFDHQKMRLIQGKYEGTVDRLATVWHSNGKDNILGISKMPDKKGESQALVIQNYCQSYNIVALVCDNASNNTGTARGTCTKLEENFDKALLRLNCRHHIYEIIVKDVYHYLFSSDTPNNFFQPILKDSWSSLRANNFPFNSFEETVYTRDLDEPAKAAFISMKKKSIHELEIHSKNNFIRDDYKEVTEVALKFLRGGRKATKRNQVEFRALINPSNARFMATCIQGLECYLFRDSLDWEKPELQRIAQNLERFCIFVALLYVRYWNRSSILFDAAANDFNFIEEIESYRLIDLSVANVAVLAMKRHLYYMSEELIPLALFSEKVPTIEKNQMRQKMNELIGREIPPRNYSGQSNHIAYTGETNTSNRNENAFNLKNLIGERSLFLFQTMNLRYDFLEMDATEWKNIISYQMARKAIADALICVNDVTERVISNGKSKYKKQRCRNEQSFHQNIILPSYS